MIASLRGTVLEKLPDRIIIDVAGVGYEVFVAQSGLFDLPGKGEEFFLHIHMEVRSEAITLYGFKDLREKALFQMLMTVSGVGPKSALAILSGISPRELAQSIASENIARLTRLPGVGKKTAERLCLELKEKVTPLLPSETFPDAGKEISGPSDQRMADVVSALVNLGYTSAVARKALDAVRGRSTEDSFAAMGIEELLRQALRVLA